MIITCTSQNLNNLSEIEKENDSDIDVFSEYVCSKT